MRESLPIPRSSPGDNSSFTSEYTELDKAANPAVFFLCAVITRMPLDRRSSYNQVTTIFTEESLWTAVLPIIPPVARYSGH